jgi:hypothetical protein
MLEEINSNCRKVKDMGHGGLAPFNPQLFVRGIERAIKEGE